MKNLRRTRLKPFLAVLILFSGSLVAQTHQKVKKSYPLDKDATISVDAEHTRLVFETWNKSEVEVEAVLEAKDLSKEEVTQALDDWQISIRGDRKMLNISSQSSGLRYRITRMPGLDSMTIITTELVGPLMENLKPLIASIPRHPLPPQFIEIAGSVKFDHEAYKKDGEKYLKKWEKEMEQKFGKDMDVVMKKWSENFEKDAEKWASKIEAEMEVHGEEIEKEMQIWAKQFEGSMEKWGEQFGKEMEVWAKQFEEGEGRKIPIRSINAIGHGNNKIKKTMIIRLPKNAKLKLNARFGEVELADKTSDLQAQISHSRLTANTIGGAKTRLDVSYSPVMIKSWDHGVLNTNYVQNASIENVKSLKLSSVSSNVKIGEINETAVISGTFGNLDILKLAPSFKTLDISLENSDLNLNIPETALNFNYNGSQSEIEYPSSIRAKPVKSYDSELINGYQKAANSEGIVTIKAKFSEVKVE